MPVALLQAGAVGHCVGSGRRVDLCSQPKAHDHEWTVPPYLWFLLVEDPGGEKSPAVISQMVGPLVKLDSRRATVDVPQRNQCGNSTTRTGRKAACALTPRPPLPPVGRRQLHGRGSARRARRQSERGPRFG